MALSGLDLPRFDAEVGPFLSDNQEDRRSLVPIRHMSEAQPVALLSPARKLPRRNLLILKEIDAYARNYLVDFGRTLRALRLKLGDELVGPL